jgi:histidinol phosphatase-like PHP family hydrolase
MTWQPVDCHAHSTFSDGKLTVAEVVERAAALGVRPSISDHMSCAASYALQDVEDVRRYLDALEQYDVLRAGEFCWHDDLWRRLPDDVVRRFTHRLGSMHAVRLQDGRLIHAFTRRAMDGISVEEYMEAHATCVEELARDMPVDVFAHPTLLTFAAREMPAEAVWTEAHETRIVDALFHAGIAFEISNRYWPHERFVRRAVDRGVRIALGSDGHTFDQVANIARPLELARRLGVKDEDIYDPIRHGSKTMQPATDRAAS